MWVLPQWEEYQKWSQAASLQDEKEIILQTCPKTKKKLDRAKILLRDLNAGTSDWNIVFFMKNTSQLNLLLTVSESQSVCKIFSSHWLVRENSLPLTKVVFTHGVDFSLQVLGVSSDFCKTGG